MSETICQCCVCGNEHPATEGSSPIGEQLAMAMVVLREARSWFVSAVVPANPFRRHLIARIDAILNAAPKVSP